MAQKTELKKAGPPALDAELARRLLADMMLIRRFEEKAAEAYALGAGVGFAINYEGGDQVCVCYFGDGAVPEGEFHEAMNLSALWKLPMIWICENNRYAMGTSLERALAQTEIWKFGEVYGIPSEPVDGMDVLAVRDVVGRAVERTRTDKTPTLIEARTYRFRGHSMRDP